MELGRYKPMSNGEEWSRFKHLNTRDEQFWFTLTALTVNGFAISSLSLHPRLVRLNVTIVSLYAIFLIVHRSADYIQGIIVYPEAEGTTEEKERSWRYKWQQTKVHLGVFFPHLWWVICEFSGSFFYITLLLLSLLAVWLEPMQKLWSCP